MSKDINELMADSLSECIPYLVAAKTGFNLPENLQGAFAGKLQKQVDNVLRAYFEQRSSGFCATIDNAIKKATIDN